MFMLRRPTLIPSSDRATGRHRKEIKNVVIFGETGVGKSSLVNLIAGEKVSETSNSIVGCTPAHTRHVLRLGGEQFAIWDTIGLGEGTHGTVPAKKAKACLKRLLCDLIKASGIDLLVYCVRGTRMRPALLASYHFFYSAICRKKVPIAIVITGLENQKGNMDTWWLQNEKQLSALQMHFDNHACVTTLESSMEDPVLRERRMMSRTALTNMITSTCRTEQWVPAERSRVDMAFSDTRAMLSSRDRHAVRVPNVIMCDVSRPAPVPQSTIKRSVMFHNPVSLFRPLIRPISFRSPVSVVNEKLQSKLPFNNTTKCTPERLFRVYQVPRRQAPSKGKDETKKDMVVKRGADLLIFCVEKEGEEYVDVKSQWEHFNLTYGGDLSPKIVMIIGARDQQSAETWWNDAMGNAKPDDASIAYLPVNKSSTEAEVARGRLRDLVNTRCIDCSKVNFTGDKHIFSRATRSSTSDKSWASLWIRPLARNNKVDAPVPADQDVLTKLGVWEHVSVG